MCTIKLAQFESWCNCFTYYLQRPVLLSWHCHRIGSAWYAQFFHSLVRRHSGRPVTDSGSPPAARRHGQWQAQPPPSRPGPFNPGRRWPVTSQWLPGGPLAVSVSVRGRAAPSPSHCSALAAHHNSHLIIQHTYFHVYIRICMYTLVYVSICMYLHVYQWHWLKTR